MERIDGNEEVILFISTTKVFPVRLYRLGEDRFFFFRLGVEGEEGGEGDVGTLEVVGSVDAGVSVGTTPFGTS